jgi:ABC-2 type transport system ATP-binding protein
MEATRSILTLFVVYCASLHAAHISGTVVDEAGNPVAEASIDHSGKPNVPPTDAMGHFELDTVAPKVVVRKDGYKSVVLLVQQSAEIRVTLLKASPDRPFPLCTGDGPFEGFASRGANLAFRRRPEITATQEGFDVDYAYIFYYLGRPDDRKSIGHFQGPLAASGMPEDRDVWWSTDYEESVWQMGIVRIIDARGTSVAGDRWRTLQIFGEAAFYSRIDPQTAVVLDQFLDGACMKRMPPTIEELRRQGSLYTDLTVDENVRFFGGLYGVSGRRLDTRRGEVLEMARLTGARHRRVAELPLGFRQRLALGCAVLHQPPILFLDEPTSGVDPMSRRGFWDLIYSLAESGTTVFVTTHYMEEAEHCHRLALMNRGRLVALDRPEALRRDFGRRVVEVRTPDPAAAAEALEGARGVAAAGLYGRTVHATLAEGGDPGAVAAALGEAGVEVEGVEPIEPSLEDVFVALVEGAGGAREE